MKEMFVELEWWIEEVVGKARIENKQVAAYKGTAKKWQILDDAVFDRDQIEKLQAACNAPHPDLLDAWKERSNDPIQAPFNNKNVKKWRDEPMAIDNADFDAKALIEERKY